MISTCVSTCIYRHNLTHDNIELCTAYKYNAQELPIARCRYKKSKYFKILHVNKLQSGEKIANLNA